MSTHPTNTHVAGQAFEEFLDSQLADPAFKAGFEKKLAKVRSIAEVLRVLEHTRELDAIPKAEIARRMQRRPEAISRLLAGQGSNPTLDTLIDLADAIGLELDIHIRRQPHRHASDYSPLKVRSTV
jgi:transcriptional regulator with XRE-family HTH domain